MKVPFKSTHITILLIHALFFYQDFSFFVFFHFFYIFLNGYIWIFETILQTFLSAPVRLKWITRLLQFDFLKVTFLMSYVFDNVLLIVFQSIFYTNSVAGIFPIYIFSFEWHYFTIARARNLSIFLVMATEWEKFQHLILSKEVRSIGTFVGTMSLR